MAILSKLLFLAGLATASQHHHSHAHHQARQGGGNVIVTNNCKYDVWLWSVDSVGGEGPRVPIPSGTTVPEPLRTVTSGGVCLKISVKEQYFGLKHTQLEYTIANGELWYNISFVDCAEGESSAKCPGADGGITMSGSAPSCGAFHCAAGSYCPTEAYFVDQPKIKLGIDEPVKTCPGAGTALDLQVTLCADNPGNDGGLALQGRSVAGRRLMI